MMNAAIDYCLMWAFQKKKRPLRVILLKSFVQNTILSYFQYAGHIMGVSNTLATIPGMTAPLFVGAIVQNQVRLSNLLHLLFKFLSFFFHFFFFNKHLRPKNLPYHSTFVLCLHWIVCDSAFFSCQVSGALFFSSMQEYISLEHLSFAYGHREKYKNGPPIIRQLLQK